MPGQAILDLPVIDFEAYLAEPGRLHELCIESYGLAGLSPHPDAVFHLTASLWRYANGQSPAQVTALATFFLKALSAFVAARRALDAAHATGTRGKGLRAAHEELDYARRDLDDLTRLCLGLVNELMQQLKRNRVAARRTIEENLQALGDAGWAREVDKLARKLVSRDASRVDWSAPLDDVLEAMQALADELAGASGNGSGRRPPTTGVDAHLVERMQTELREYQAIANQASVRLRQIDKERRDLEAILSRTGRGTPDTERVGLPEVLRREKPDTGDLVVEEERARLQNENRRLHQENERLSAELLGTMSGATEGESRAEELIERIEQMDSHRLEAAAAIEQLSRRLGRVQHEAAGASQAAARAAELEALVGELRREVTNGQARFSQANETIRALEQGTGRDSDWENELTQSEARLAETETRLVEFQSRTDQLAGQMEERDYRIGQLEQRVAAGKRTVDTLSGQLAESETVAAEQASRVRELERENERLRRESSDATGRLADAQEAERRATAELTRARDEARAERSKAEITRAETGRVQDEIKGLRQRAEKAETEGRSLRKEATEAAAAATESRNRARESDEKLKRAERELVDARKQLTATESSSRQAAVNAGNELVSAKEKAERAQAELEALRRSESSAADVTTRLRVELSTAQAQLVQTREQAAASLELVSERLKRSDEKLALAAERARNSEMERSALSAANEATERGRVEERQGLEAAVARLRNENTAQQRAVADARKDADALKTRANEADAVLIARERELEAQASRVKALTAEINELAALRARLEAAAGPARDELARQIARKIDALCAAPAGREKKVKPTARVPKKETARLPKDAPKPATNGGDDSKDDQSMRRRKPDAKS